MISMYLKTTLNIYFKVPSARYDNMRNFVKQAVILGKIWPVIQELFEKSLLVHDINLSQLGLFVKSHWRWNFNCCFRK